MAFIGNTNTTQAFTPAIDYFSGNGSTTAFTLSRPVASVAQVQVTIDNVAQNPSSAFTVSSNTITFTSAPLSGTNNIYVYYTSPITQVIAPSQGTVQTAQLGNITNIASGNSSLTLQTGSGNTTAITVDTSQRVGVGTTSPQRKVSIVGTDGASGQTEDNSRTSLFLDNNGANYLSIFTSTSGDGGVFFSDNGQNNGGMVYETSSDALYFKANNAERMRINSSGYVTTPSQPAFRAYLNSTYTCTTGYQTIPFDNTSLNTSSSFSTGTSTFTAPIAGTYFFTAMAYWFSSGTAAAYAGCTIWSNGAQKATGYIYKNSAGGDECAWSSLIISMAAGDTAYVRTDMSTGLVVASGATGGSWFCGYLLG